MPRSSGRPTAIIAIAAWREQSPGAPLRARLTLYRGLAAEAHVEWVGGASDDVLAPVRAWLEALEREEAER